jgi:RNA polymerase sigma-70 factor (ECF subfamily)
LTLRAFAPAVAMDVANDALLAALASGDRDALRDVYLLYHAYVRAFARRLVGDDAAAEDLVHEAFLVLPRAARRYRGDGPFRAFLLSIAVNHARHHVRAAARRRAAQAKMLREPLPEPARPDDEAARVELARALSAALDALPLDQRVAFVLCEVEERTSTEAAVIVGATPETIRARVFHAKRKLRTVLEEGP